MSDTEREAFGAWFRRQYDRDLVSKLEIAERAYIEGRRSTTTEARALTTEEIEAIYEREMGQPLRVQDRPAVFKVARAILAARAPAPPSVPRLLDRDEARLALWQAISNITIGNKTDDKLILAELYKLGFWLAGPPAPSVPDSDQGLSAATKALADGVELALGGHPTEAKASAVQRPAGGDEQ